MTTARERWKTLLQLEKWLEAPMLFLGLAWLVIVVLELAYGATDLLATLGTAIWVLFILEFLLRFTLAPSKRRFLKRNWLTAIALFVPALRVLRGAAMLRAVRAIRGMRLIRIVGTANRSMNALRRTLSRRGFGYVVALTLLVLSLGAAGMLSFEPAREVPGGFTSYGHALWWTGMLIASIGTDFWPVTVEGRILSAILSLYGLAVFGYVTATLASFFIGRDTERATGPSSAEIDRLQHEIRALRGALAGAPLARG